MSNASKETDLYPPMCAWLDKKLRDLYRDHYESIEVVDAHAKNLSVYLTEHGCIDEYPQTVGLDIQIDVLGIVKTKERTHLAFIEAKKTQLCLRDLGQLWAYCKLCDPDYAYLLSSKGLGGLNKILRNMGREDMLDFGDGKVLKKMRVGKWDVERKMPDYVSMIPSS